MQRLRLALLLPLLLVLAQQGAVLHELSHIRYSGSALTGAELRDAQPPADGSPCAACLSFAQVASTAAASLSPLLAPRAARQRSPEPRYVFAALAPPTPRSRGPPAASS